MVKVLVYCDSKSDECRSAKSLLSERHIAFEEIDVTGDLSLQQEIAGISGHSSVPQIFVAGQSIGGWYELSFLDASGALDRLLALDPIEADAVRRIVA